MKKRPLIVLVLVLVAVAGACASKGPYPATGLKGEPLDRKHSVLYLDQSLPKVLFVTAQKAERRPDGRLAVEVSFMNDQPKRVHVQIETQFRTVDGSPVETTPFRDFFIAGNATTTYAITAMNDRSDTFLMQIRRVN